MVIDDTARIRSIQTTKLWGVHKLKDKKTNGYVKGQELVILVLVTPKITLPVGFEFYRPDPTFRDWQKKDEKLRELKVPRRERPIKPTRDPKFPTKQAICLSLVRGFRYLTASSVHVHSMLADAAYQSCYFLNECRKIFPKSRVISQLRSNQIVQNHQ